MALSIDTCDVERPVPAIGSKVLVEITRSAYPFGRTAKMFYGRVVSRRDACVDGYDTELTTVRFGTWTLEGELVRVGGWRPSGSGEFTDVYEILGSDLGCRSDYGD